jgi:bifunctional non-homologous end joining protein LigD
VGVPVIVDGEIIAIGQGRPDFGLLQSRMHVRDPPASLVRQAPVQLYLFDLLHHNGQSLLPAPYTGRRERLAELGLDADPVRTTPWYPGGAADVRAVSLAHALEGVIGKPLASAYHPGQRRDWIKIKNTRQQEVIICGWKPGQGRRADTIGSLLVGVWDGPRLRYAGHVGTGFTQAALGDLTRRLQPLRRDDSPFGTTVPALHARGAQWVHPRLVGEVAFTEWTADKVLRHPSWRGLRTDKNPGQVHQEN